MGTWSCTCNSHGNSSSDVIYYTTPLVGKSWIIRASQFDAVETDINRERTRTSLSSINITTGIGNTVDAVDLNTMITALQGVYAAPRYNSLGTSVVGTVGDGLPSLTSTISVGSLITADKVNALISNLKAAGAVCVCNCNYCSCNCNYCTCNCNYACTCNCNYSDENLKTNIEYL